MYIHKSPLRPYMFLCFKVIESKSMNSFGKVKGWEKKECAIEKNMELGNSQRNMG